MKRMTKKHEMIKYVTRSRIWILGHFMTSGTISFTKSKLKKKGKRAL